MSTPNPAPQLLDRAGRPMPAHAKKGFRAGLPPANRGRKYPPQAFTPSEAQALLQACVLERSDRGGPTRLAMLRTRALCVLLYRSGLRIQEALDLEERDLDFPERQITVRSGKGGKRRVVGMDAFGWNELNAWMERRGDLPIGTVFPVLSGPTKGAPWFQNDARSSMRNVARRSGIRRRVNPHAWRHTFAVEAWREGIDILTIQRQLGHARLDITQAYLVSLGADDLLTPVMERGMPMVPMSLEPWA